MAVIKVGNNSIGKISVIQPYEDPTGKSTHFYDIDPEPWVRPSGWLDMPTDDNMVAALIFVPSGAHDFTVSVYARGTGTSSNNVPTYIPIDWGDNTSGLIYGTRYDNGVYNGYFSSHHKMYDYDLLSSDTEIEIGGTTARQALIKLDGSVSGIGYFNLRPLAGNDFGYQNRRDETERKYEFYDTSGVIRTAPPRNGHRRNNQTSTLLEVYASGTSITGCKLSEDYPEGLHRYIEKAYLNIGNFGTDVDLFYGASNLQDVYFPYAATTGKTNFKNMFHGCRNLKSTPSFDTSSATSLESTFRNCRSIKTVPNFDTSNVTNWNGTFLGCVNIKKIPDLACVWLDFGCHDCHLNSLQFHENVDKLGIVEHNCVDDDGHDLVVNKQLYHPYSKIRMERKPIYKSSLCYGTSCRGRCIYLNAIGVDLCSKRKHTMELSNWKQWWFNMTGTYHLTHHTYSSD